MRVIKLRSCGWWICFATVALLGAGQPSAPAAPLVLNASIPLTGPAAFLGKSFVDAFHAAEIVVNNAGGIRGRQLKIATTDSQTSPVVGLQNVQGFVSQAFPMFIDGGPSAVCNAASQNVARSGPVDYCLSPIIQPAANSFVFSTGPSGGDILRVAVRYFRLRGWTRVAMISPTDATGAELEAQTMAALANPENRDVVLVAREHFSPSDVSVAAQVARVEAARPQAIFVWATGTSVAVVMRTLNDSGNTAPVLLTGANLVSDQLNAYTPFLPKQLFFTALLGLTPHDTPAGPVRDAQMTYERAFKAIGADHNGATDLAWDPVMILVAALRHLGPNATAAQVHDYILHLHGWIGINGTYDFGAGDQRGVGENAVEITQWVASKRAWFRVSHQRGYPL